MRVQAEVSFYPLAQDHMSGSLDRFCRAVSAIDGLNVSTGSMSSVISGESDTVMHSLAQAIEIAGEDLRFVLVCKISNSCPFE